MMQHRIRYITHLTVPPDHWLQASLWVLISTHTPVLVPRPFTFGELSPPMVLAQLLTGGREAMVLLLLWRPSPSLPLVRRSSLTYGHGAKVLDGNASMFSRPMMQYRAKSTLQ